MTSDPPDRVFLDEHLAAVDTHPDTPASILHAQRDIIETWLRVDPASRRCEIRYAPGAGLVVEVYDGRSACLRVVGPDGDLQHAITRAMARE